MFQLPQSTRKKELNPLDEGKSWGYYDFKVLFTRYENLSRWLPISSFSTRLSESCKQFLNIVFRSAPTAVQSCIKHPPNEQCSQLIPSEEKIPEWFFHSMYRPNNNPSRNYQFCLGQTPFLFTHTHSNPLSLSLSHTHPQLDFNAEWTHSPTKRLSPEKDPSPCGRWPLRGSLSCCKWVVTAESTFCKRFYKYLVEMETGIWFGVSLAAHGSHTPQTLQLQLNLQELFYQCGR